MGDFKDKHGKTRIGSFLETLGDVAKPLLNIAGELTGIDALNAIADNIKNSDVLTDVQKTVALDLLKLDIENEKERTKRHQTDMSSDSWLSKNIRPMSLIFLLIMVLFFVPCVVLISICRRIMRRYLR